MNFLFPAFLTALAGISVPIIIHLFRFRRFKRVYFSDIRFLKELKEETDSRNKLRHLLVLLCRIFTIVFLVLAFAQPFLTQKKIINGNINQPVSIFVDNSFSMATVGEQGTLLDEAKQKAAEIVSAYPPSTSFQLLTQDFEGKHQRLVNREEFLEMLEEVKPGGNSKALSEIFQRQKDILAASGETPASLYYLSDFQTSAFGKLTFGAKNPFNVFLLPLKGNPSANLAIDSLWFAEPVQLPGAQTTIYAQVINYGTAEANEIPVRLIIDGKQKAVTNLSLLPGEKKKIDLAFTQEKKGLKFGELSLEDNPVTFDNHFYFSYVLEDKIKVLDLHQGQANAFLNSLFGQDSSIYFVQQNEKNIDFASFADFDFIILNQYNALSTGLVTELIKFVEAGHFLLVMPPVNNLEPAGYDLLANQLGLPQFRAKPDTVRTQVENIQYRHRIFKNVFEADKLKGNILNLPKVLQYYRWSNQSSAAEEQLLGLMNRVPLLSAFVLPQGGVYYSAVAADDLFGNFHRHALFVPSLFNMALYSKNTGPLYFTLGKEEAIAVRNSSQKREDILHLKGLNNKIDFIPSLRKSGFETKINFYGQIKQDGNFLLLNQGNDSLKPLSFNYDRRESSHEFLAADKIKATFSDAGFDRVEVISGPEGSLNQTIKELNEGTSLWKFCLIIALIFITLEIILLRWLS
jgi:hypothetical protein